MKYYIISGETSGDQHAAQLIEEIRKLDPNSEFRGLGGDSSEKAGLHLLIHHKKLAFMGFLEVLRNLSTIRKALNAVKSDIDRFEPDQIILIDYPGFNLRIASYAHNFGIPVHYYIAPKVWAWNEKRVKKIRAYVDHLYCILPFEKAYFDNHHVSNTYVGNPSWSAIRTFIPEENFAENQGLREPVIALLPGSRKQEIEHILPLMLKVLQHFPEYQPAVAQAPGFDENFYKTFDPDIVLIKDNMHNLLSISSAALVTSGTATLETALLDVPQLVCYKTSRITYYFAKWLIKLPFISLVNIILNKAVVKELIQDDLNEDHLKLELHSLLNNEDRKDSIKADYQDLKERLSIKEPSKIIAGMITSTEVKD